MCRDQFAANVDKIANETLRQSRRDQWAPTLATIVTAIHLLAGMVLFSWNYHILPRVKQVLDSLGKPISEGMIFLIRQSDLVVNYWYVLVLVSPILLTLDFQITRWIGKQLGLSVATIWGLLLTILVLSHVMIGYLAFSPYLR